MVHNSWLTDKKSEKIKKMVDECIEEDDKNKNHNWKVNLQFLFYLGKIEITIVFSIGY